MAGDRRLPLPVSAYDASDPEQVKKAEAAARLRDEARKAIQAGLISSPEGREWAWQVMRDTGLFKDRTITDSEYANGFSDGQREVGFALMRSLCRANPQTFALLIQENDH